jgi:hypothetical protein
VLLALIVIALGVWAGSKFFTEPQEIYTNQNPETPKPADNPIGLEEAVDFGDIDPDKIDQPVVDLKTLDSDADGLNDFDEINVYKTNQYNVDTDGDGYKDGDEVKNGYNPNGAGKLLNAPVK